jgi:hypothetical protein
MARGLLDDEHDMLEGWDLADVFEWKRSGRGDEEVWLGLAEDDLEFFRVGGTRERDESEVVECRC